MKKLFFFIFITFFTYNLASADEKRILIVPGHDDEYSGAMFAGTKEVELNRIVAKELVEELSKIEDVEVINAHDDNGYAAFIEKYFRRDSKKIDSFIKKNKKSFAKSVKKGDIEVEEAVPHGTATSFVL